jgi:xyloglucan galactosyltransferase MUR3
VLLVSALVLMSSRMGEVLARKGGGEEWGRGGSVFRFYVYDWPSYITTTWPAAYTFKKRLAFSASDRENDGLGKVVDDSRGLFKTHQYSLFEIFWKRLLESPMRTLNPAEASTFFVPYDIGMDATVQQSDGRLKATNCPRGDSVLERLSQSPHFGDGSNHFMLTSINQVMGFYLTPTCSRVYNMCHNCTKLSIDVYPDRMYRELLRNPSRSYRWFSVPFPSNFHYGKHVTHLPWRLSDDVGKRKYLLSFMGTDKITATRCRLLRLAIISQCQERPDEECYFERLQSHDSTVPLKQVYANSRLCLMPGGDFPSRKAVLDSLFSGCIPVLFQKTTATMQWGWHWGDMVDKVSVFMPLDHFVKYPAGSVDKLVRVAQDEERIHEMRQAWSTIAFRMQYNQLGAVNEGNKDAVDVVLDHFATVNYV